MGPTAGAGAEAAAATVAEALGGGGSTNLVPLPPLRDQYFIVEHKGAIWCMSLSWLGDLFDRLIFLWGFFDPWVPLA